VINRDGNTNPDRHIILNTPVQIESFCRKSLICLVLSKQSIVPPNQNNLFRRAPFFSPGFAKASIQFD